MEKKYLLFVWGDYESRGCFDNFEEEFLTVEAAEEYFSRNITKGDPRDIGNSNGEIVEIEGNCRVVRDFGYSENGNCFTEKRAWHDRQMVKRGNS
jgi:hypothetical protein